MESIERADIRKLFPELSNAELGLPDLKPIDWGVLDYFGWIHPSGHKGFVILPRGDGLFSLSLSRSIRHDGKARTRMCSWCHHVYRSKGTALFSAKVIGSDDRRFIGNHICSNLDCSLRIRNLPSDPPTYLPETLNIEKKIARLEASVVNFMGRANVCSQLIDKI
jgi:hypothetical protein